MKFKFGKDKHLAKEKAMNKELAKFEWHDKFVIFPRCIGENEYAFMQWVKRKKLYGFKCETAHGVNYVYKVEKWKYKEK